MLGMDHQPNNNLPRINFDRSKIRLWPMLPRNPDCALNLTCEMNRIFMKTPTWRASPAGSGDHVFQSVRSFANAGRRTGGTLIDCNIRLVSPLPTGATHGRSGELAKRSSASGGRLESAVCALRGVARTQLPAKPGEVAARAAATSYFQFIDRTRAAGRLNGHKFIEDLPCTGVEPYK